MNFNPLVNQLALFAKLLRWDKPSGRLILLIPAGWALWLTPNGPPDFELIFLIFTGGLLVSGAGCIANDLWDKKFDPHVERTKNRPLANGSIETSNALGLLALMLCLSLIVVISLPEESKGLCLLLAILAIPFILIYPSAKRWFAYPQIFLAICWGFAVLIPWAASQGSLNGGIPLFSCWFATVLWTFGFDTVYAMADIEDDKSLGLKSSAISLGSNSSIFVSISYGFTSFFIGLAGFSTSVNWPFWLCWLIASLGMQLQTSFLEKSLSGRMIYSNHFKNQVWLGSLFFLGLILGSQS